MTHTVSVLPNRAVASCTRSRILAASACATLRPNGCDAIVAPPLVVQMRIRAVVRLFDEALREHLADRPVEHTRAEGELPVGPARDLAFQRIAMTFPIAQAQQDVEHGRGQRQEVFGIWLWFRHTSTKQDLV